MTVKRLSIALTVLVAMPCCADRPSEHGDSPKVDPVERCYGLAARLGLYGFDTRKEECTLRVVQQNYDEDLMCDTVSIESTRYDGKPVDGLRQPVHASLFSFEVNGDTGEIVHLSNYYLALWSWEEDNLPEEEPLLTEDKVLEQARGYITLIGTTELAELGKDYAVYDDSVRAGGKAWRTSFFRKQGGYYFKNDYISIVLNEQHGLRGYYKRFFSEPCTIPEVIVSVDELKAKPLTRVREMLDAGGFKHKGELVNIARTDHELLIINPAMCMYKTEKAKALEKQETALVHEMEYTVKWFVKKGNQVEETRKVVLSVCFDAGTGEFLCGDYVLF